VGGANAGLAARMLEFGRTSEPWEAFAEEVKSIDPDVIALQELGEERANIETLTLLRSASPR